MIERALEAALKRAGAAEVSLYQQRNVSAAYEDDKLKRVDVSQTTSLGIRVIVDGKVGTARTTHPEEAEWAVERALALAEFGSEAKFDFPGPADFPEVKSYDPEVEKTSNEELVAAGGEMLELLKSYNPEIKVSADASWSVGEWRQINSSGLEVRDRSSGYGAGVGGMLLRGTDMLMAGHGRYWRKKDVKPREQAERAIEMFRLAERVAQVASKTMPVIFTPRGAYLLLAPIQLGIDGKNVLKGDSPLAGRLGEKLCSEKFTLIDDGTIDYAPASGRFDGEGIPKRRTEIIKNGALKAFLYDLETAGKAGTVSTGHGPGCSPSNLVVSPGSMTLEEMIRTTREGLLVEHVMGLGQSNIMNGDFSVNLSLAYKIENGEIVGRVKNAMLAGNLYEALKRVEAIGSDAEWNGSNCLPSIKMEELSVVAK